MQCYVLIVPFVVKFREEGEKAANALRQALGDYDLKFSVILNDPDMAAFRAMPEFKQLQDEVTSCPG